ncbi:MAG: hypothetical protein WDO17_16850 [Alphaproteobacteria bacterium]
MRSILSRLAIAGIVGALAASALTPATAATRHKRAPAPAQTEIINEPVAARPSQSTVPSIFMNNECVSDEGYGRYSSCDPAGAL